MDTLLDLRKAFLNFFEADRHTVMKSSPLVTAGDPTLMFVNAGMVPFKDIFTGQRHSDARRVATCQKCMRVSGKHNDLEEVGRTPRHHTLFEMLGNFSFGDYFKEHAIDRAWTLVHRELKIPKEKLWVTVFEGDASAPADDEAAALWQKISGLSEDRILRCSAADNFWSMGDTGPCGPCTEIYVDLAGPDAPAPTRADFHNGRILEIWNLVFMQFNRTADGVYHPLPAPCVDTGMGLERVTAVALGETSNYHTPLFLPLLMQIQDEAKKHYTRSSSDDDVSMRVIADHARATAFLMADGVRPSNEGRGYVLRRIMRRAIRHADRLGIKDLFFHRIAHAVTDVMGSVYPELHEARAFIEKMTMLEEETFRRTLKHGLQLLQHEMDAVKKTGGSVLPGETAFKLYDTYGFPKDLTDVITHEHRMTVDDAGFSHAMEAQRERSRGSAVGEAAVDGVYQQIRNTHGPVTFVGYMHPEDALQNDEARVWEDGQDAYVQTQTRVVALVQGHTLAEGLTEGEGYVVLDPTPFYGESGGQVGDTGWIVNDDTAIEVLDTQKPVDDLTVCKVRVVRGALRVNDQVWAGYHRERRAQTRIHHSATHLLHASLRKILGPHVAQAGSYVDHEKLRFDFSHTESMTPDQRAHIENDVYHAIHATSKVTTDVLSFDAAKQKGAIALFGEKYGDVVRVISMGESVEFCGGTHVNNTSDIGLVLISQEGALSAGIRRMEALAGSSVSLQLMQWAQRLNTAVRVVCDGTGVDGEDPVLVALHRARDGWHQSQDAVTELGLQPAVPAWTQVSDICWKEGSSLDVAQQIRDLMEAVTAVLNSKPSDAKEITMRYHVIDNGLLANLVAMQEARLANEKLIEQAKKQQTAVRVGELVKQCRDVAGIALLTADVSDVASKDLRPLAESLRNQCKTGVFCLASAQEGKVSLLVAVSADLTSRYSAATLLAAVAPCIGGRGGGKPDMAQAGGAEINGIPLAFEKLQSLVANH